VRHCANVKLFSSDADCLQVLDAGIYESWTECLVGWLARAPFFLLRWRNCSWRNGDSGPLRTGDARVDAGAGIRTRTET